MKDILIGGADGYTFEQVKPWFQSAKDSGFMGEIWLIVYRMASDDIARLEQAGVKVYEVKHDPYGQPIRHAGPNTPTQAHNLRFYHAWELLTRLSYEGEHFRYTIMTDVSDVIFQTNPIIWLEKQMDYDFHSWNMVVSSEGIKYQDEEWGRDNLINGFGEITYDLIGKDWRIQNVGVLAGHGGYMKGLFNTIFRMTEGRFYPSDQSSFNVLLRSGMIDGGEVEWATHDGWWACQLGTTMDPTKPWLWDRLQEPRPTIRPDGLVVNKGGRPYAIVHQWNRVPELKTLITEKYK
jgi:hypothetical protein